MKKELIQEYSMRVTQASRSELVVIMYEVILKDIEHAKEVLPLLDEETYEKELTHAGRFLNELMGALDYHYSISYRLMSLYIYLNRRLTEAKFQKSAEILDELTELIEGLRTSYEGVSRQDTSGPMMRNTEQVYAGLTYGRGTLNETRINGNEVKRGFLA